MKKLLKRIVSCRQPLSANVFTADFATGKNSLAQKIIIKKRVYATKERDKWDIFFFVFGSWDEELCVQTYRLSVVQSSVSYYIYRYMFSMYNDTYNMGAAIESTIGISYSRRKYLAVPEK